VAVVSNSEQQAGYHEEAWNAANVPSGVFFYQLFYTDESGSRHVERKKMMILK
jgi:hypothetical protein